MFAYQNDAEEFAVTSRALPARSKPQSTGYSPRHDRRAKPAARCNGIHRRGRKSLAG